jgi:L-alanine-DL-glutamate epimerase-like enolase superfamily enzyme
LNARLGDVVPRIEHVRVRVFEVPTVIQPETDGTAAWSSTTMVVVELAATGITGLGYSYVHAAAAKLVEDLLADCLRGASPLDIPHLHGRMIRAVRNQGLAGIAACAISAVDIALWDLKARLLGVSVTQLLGAARHDVPVYASGGFTSTPLDALARELEGYVAAGHRRVKIKIGRPLASAFERARVASEAAGADIELMVDANGAFTRKEAIELVPRLEAIGVRYFEEPVSSDDLAGLRQVKDASRLAVAAGEYGYDAKYFHRMLAADAVDILQADTTRCLGFTGFLQADALCDAAGVPLSAHCAPALHVHVGRAARRIVHVEHFFDHVRLESMLFDGVPRVTDGMLIAEADRLGLGLVLRDRDAARFAA